ncbi:hypothetical protein BCR34DRAFT_606605 [Clohesyomyces aquaticus]|uniref:Uncharacterized protein n=1 Tax=Clohesyomyces aquaticus TaxID=1231657 RepID=A0A1Y1YNE6_9PLEO|nr:hypothetical protein BCR34DRAFT_606605 [Clohesyomyces aquaticus]
MAAIAPPRPDISMRPHGSKENAAVDLDRLFDEYVEPDPLQHFSVDTMDPSSTDDAAILFDLPASNGSYPIESTGLPNWDAGLDEPWREAMRDPKQNRASPTMSDISFTIYPESRVKTAKSDPGLLKVDDVFELDEFERRLSLSNPTTPTPLNTRPARKARSPTPDQSSRRGVNKLRRKPNFQPRMMQSSHFRPGIQDMWTRRLDAPNESFNLQLPPNILPNSPPQSVKLEQRREGGHAFFAHDQPYSIAMSPLPTTSDGDLHHSNYQLTPLSTPSLDTSSSRHSSAGNAFQFSNDGNSTLSSSYLSHNLNQQLSSEALSISALQTQPSTSTHRLSVNAGADETWGSDTPASLEFAFSASPNFCTPENGKSQPTWWTGTAEQPTPSPAYRERQAQSQNQNQNQHLSFSNRAVAGSNTAVAGLGISCDTSSFSSYGGDLNLGNSQSTSFPASSVAASSFETTYPTPAIYHPTTTTVSHRNLSIDRHHRRERTRSRSPPQMHFSRTVTHRRHTSHSHPQSHPQSHSRPSPSRRKTSSNPNLSTPSSSTSPHKPSPSAKPSSSPCVSVSSFVNFTPLDSRKILTGVAPSGSSKTKARREKEAADKRRRLSQAAVKAVMEAGGDLGRLEREGVLFG